MWKCFAVYQTDREARFLRRIADGECPGPYHNHCGSVRIEDGPLTKAGLIPGKTDEYWHGRPPVSDYDKDQRWPTKCDYCDYVFEKGKPSQTLDLPRQNDGGNGWYIDTYSLYKNSFGRIWHERELPVGAMFDTPWLKPENVGPDGMSLTVILPPGQGILDSWHIDHVSSSGGHWERTGVAPDHLVVTPSILSSSYHGFLGSNGAPPGYLSDCLPDKADDLAKETARLKKLGWI